jgi:predicted transcriptional regulator
VLEALNGRTSKKRAYTTIMTIMSRLDRKGLLTRRREGKADVYVPALSRDDYLEARARAQVGALVDEYGDVALVHFARQMARLDPGRREKLRRLARRDG